ncbi:hypothetical protein NEOKW01_1011 [Nematocida sp. AWRm80]|nr:hypothetical protein NEOKW01_1011 [Nematocida sp. AWRm80]
MAQCTVELVFPFKVNGREHKTELQTNILREENTVILDMPFLAMVTLETRKKYKVHYIPSENGITYSVSIEFQSINDAIEFESTPKILLSYLKENTLLSLEDKLEEAANELEATQGNWKRRKRVGMVDEDGFTIV